MYIATGILLIERVFLLADNSPIDQYLPVRQNRLELLQTFEIENVSFAVNESLTVAF